MQMKKWLNDNGVEAELLGKKQVAEIIKDTPKEISEVLLVILNFLQHSE